MDAELILQAQKGDKMAFRDLVTRYKTDIYRLCASFTGEAEDSRDLAQETFIKAHHKLHLYRFTGSFRGWLSTMAYRLFLNLCEKKKRRLEAVPFIEQEMAFTAQLNQESAENPPDRAEGLRNALDKLPEEYRTCLSLKYENGYSLREIAQTLGMPAATIKTRLYRGKLLLSKAIRQWEKIHGEV